MKRGANGTMTGLAAAANSDQIADKVAGLHQVISYAPFPTAQSPAPSAWQCPGCGVWYAWHVRSCECSKKAAAPNPDHASVDLPQTLTETNANIWDNFASGRLIN